MSRGIEIILKFCGSELREICGEEIEGVFLRGKTWKGFFLRGNCGVADVEYSA
jgi:hypothetical protein